MVRVRDVLASPGASPPSREALGALKSMGFDAPRATYALRRAGGDLDGALAFLLDDEARDEAAPRAPRQAEPVSAEAFDFRRGSAIEGASAASEASALVAADASDADLARALALSLELADAEARVRRAE